MRHFTGVADVIVYMDNSQIAVKDISVTRIAGLFVTCVMIAGFVIFAAASASTHNHSGYLLCAFVVAAIALITGGILSVRSVIKLLR